MNAPLVVEGELTVYVAHELRLRMLQALQALGADAALRLDLSGVAEFDGAGLQLLLAARREALHRGGRLEIAAASPVVTETLALAGCTGLFAPTLAAEGLA